MNTVISWVPEELGADPSGAQGPLNGVRIGVKDNIEVAGVRSTCGSAYFADRMADRDAACVAALKRAGATITSTLNLAEFAVGVTSQNSASGGPVNPWDAGRVPGGSSGGSGVAVAAGVVDVALGTDTGGSIRLPAACCGVTGLRPSTGVLDMSGIFPVSAYFDTVGPLARTARQVRETFAVLAGSDVAGVDADNLRVAVPRPFVTDDVDPAIADAVGETVELLRRLGHRVVECPVPHSESAQDVVYTLVYSDLARTHAERLRDEPTRFQQATRERIALGLTISDEQRAAALRERDLFRAAMTDMFGEIDVVLTPAMPVDVPRLGGGETVVAQARRMGQLTYPWSLHDGPTLALPVGVHPSGMPIGAQLTAARLHEGTLLALAEQIQAHSEWHLRVPPVRVSSDV
ncbi:aspartyl/glutamyl-tRNA(Asn/Gln) amidotransferase subunit A [Gordonia namibiensis NBRC 108229]|uniref:Aspartyl/glutamyl-tRNA(Asn/Gln) amidotransferase subunit A n=1 Tax=Gordonia namibiensis NBRC 108229 TaxID=1208314 RepID=K6X888_9ACTN|nr:amidase [Gordonia namibiensis]GAC02282.1 aspartyl/glutamyl-tRNA(Asn/Gln) amidotransferase subunit A [Gordonia namibiensis NBRC 108229]